MDPNAAYENGPYIAWADSYPPRWKAASDALLSRVAHKDMGLRYGPNARNTVDILHPEGAAKGLAVIVHGGYWRAFSPADFAFLAEGALRAGWSVALPSYDLCPDVRIPQITTQVAAAIDLAAGHVDGPLRLTGHSAGGHLVARMLCADVDLACRDRIVHVLPLSPLGDLRALVPLTMNSVLQLDGASAATESACLHPAPSVPVTVWVGEDERPGFLDQARGLSQAWGCPCVIEPGRHHFDVIDGLTDAQAPLCRAFLEGPDLA